MPQSVVHIPVSSRSFDILNKNHCNLRFSHALIQILVATESLTPNLPAHGYKKPSINSKIFILVSVQGGVS